MRFDGLISEDDRTMNITPLHAGISVGDIEESIRWYRDVLGFEPGSRVEIPHLNAEVVFIRNGEYEIELFRYENPKPLPQGRKYPDSDIQTIGMKHIAFRTYDYAAMMKHFKEQGVDIVLDTVMEGNPTCYIRDNSGILIEIIEKNNAEEKTS